MTKTLLFSSVVLLIFGACVPNRKIVYLQKNDVNKMHVLEDTTVRMYSQAAFSYKIQPNDALYIRFESLTPPEYDFFDQTEATGGAGGNGMQLRSELVDPAGNISFPVIGKLKVSGLTVFEVQDTLQALANKYLKSPVVKVRLVNFRFTILGEVIQEGTITTLNNRITLPEAIGLAGGLTDLASRGTIKVIRQNNGMAQVAYIDVLDEHLLQSPYYYINQNDIIIVPPLKQRPFRKYFGQNVGLILSATTLVTTMALLFVNLTD
jgi:polysaccharide export outer membrane protein